MPHQIHAGATTNAGLQNAFRALADPNRRTILMLLTDSDMSIGDVAGHFDITRAAVKKHLTILEKGKLISVRTNGRERINHLEPLALKNTSDWFEYFSRFWDEKLTNLQSAVEAAEGTDNG